MHLPWRSGRLEGTDLADQSSCGGLFIANRHEAYVAGWLSFGPDAFAATMSMFSHGCQWNSIGAVYPLEPLPED